MSIKDLKIIRKAETEEFVSSNDQQTEEVAMQNKSHPKSVFLHALGNNITTNIVEVFVDESGKLDYVIQSTILYVNEFRYSSNPLSHSEVKIEFAYNSRFFGVLEHTQSELQLFFIDNKSLVAPGDTEPAAILLHPLGSVKKLCQIPAHDFVWRSDALE